MEWKNKKKLERIEKSSLKLFSISLFQFKLPQYVSDLPKNQQK